MQFLTKLFSEAQAVVEGAADTAPEIFFQPAKFIENLKYMGIGMLVIFVLIGIIILTTMMINKVFSE